MQVMYSAKPAATAAAADGGGVRQPSAPQFEMLIEHPFDDKDDLNLIWDKQGQRWVDMQIHMVPAVIQYPLRLLLRPISRRTIHTNTNYLAKPERRRRAYISGVQSDIPAKIPSIAYKLHG